MERLTELENEPARALAAEYMHEADVLLGRLPESAARHYHREVEARLITALNGARFANAETVREVLDEIGSPGHFLPGEIAANAAREAARTLNPRRVVEALRYGAMAGVGKASAVAALGFLYMGALLLFLTGIARLVSPEAAGLYERPDGAFILAIAGSQGDGARDVLGLAYAPVAMIVAAGLYAALTILLPALVGRRRRR
ncbi:hypothetical protein [Glycocaulis sp.]|uniref:hypothetical protein n=1 Tax=Glycocaulis sp. TaxID=1969725 RepID=UPI0025C5EF83|nr:hypothetical protein [Glycocaulis sp.]MCH8521209.1 hypothetical protein [Glycocaulis sp.]